MTSSDKVAKTIATILIVIVAGISFHALISVFLTSLVPQYGDVIKAWKELLILISVLLLVVILYVKKSNVSSHKKVITLSTAFILLHVFMLCINPQSYYQTVAGLFIDLRYVLFFLVTLLFLTLYPVYKNTLLKVYGWAALLVVVFGFLQVTILPADFLKHFGYGESTIQPYLTVDKNPDYVRINSTLRGPNPLGVYAAGFLIILMSYVLMRYKTLSKHAKVLIGVGSVAATVCLWFSYSRSALIMAVLGLGMLASIFVYKQWGKKVFVTIATVSLLVSGVSLYLIKDTYFVQHVVFHNNPDESNPINSDHQHETSLLMASSKILQHPLGSGIGTTGSASLRSDQPLIIESQYLFIAHEIGVVGLALYLLLFGLLLFGLWQNKGDPLSLGVLVSGVGIAIVGLVQPVFVDDTISLVWWGLAAIGLSTYAKSKDKKSDKKTARTS